MSVKVVDVFHCHCSGYLFIVSGVCSVILVQFHCKVSICYVEFLFQIFVQLSIINIRALTKPDMFV